jgi:hypothetical protein
MTQTLASPVLYPTTKQEPALRRALMRVNPAYFAWPDEEKERYHVTQPAADFWRIKQHLLQDLFGILVRDQTELDAALDEFDTTQYLQLTRALLPITGIGKDSFVLNEHLAASVTLLDFPTLYAYAHDDHHFQEAARKEFDPAYKGRPFRGDLHFCWARLFIDETFYYATLSSTASFISGGLETVGAEKIAQLIPHGFVEGKQHGAREGDGFLWDLRVDAAGLERQLEELEHRFWNYVADRHETLLDEFDQNALRRVYLRPRVEESEPHIDFVFSDQTALQAVRFKHFLADCRSLAGVDQELKQIEEREISALIEFLTREYQEIITNFDPHIIKLRKKHKIVIAESAAEDFF